MFLRLVIAFEWLVFWQTVAILQSIYPVWVHSGWFVTNPARLTTLLPSSCSWPLPPPVAEGSPHPSATHLIPSLPALHYLRASPCTPPPLPPTSSSSHLACMPASGGSFARGGWVTVFILTNTTKHQHINGVGHKNTGLKGRVSEGFRRSTWTQETFFSHLLCVVYSNASIFVRFGIFVNSSSKSSASRKQNDEVRFSCKQLFVCAAYKRSLKFGWFFCKSIQRSSPRLALRTDHSCWQVIIPSYVYSRVKGQPLDFFIEAFWKTKAARARAVHKVTSIGGLWHKSVHLHLRVKWS